MNQPSPERYPPIENYGIIGNLNTVALVSLGGSIDFLSYTRFDSPTLFCKLLDADKGGCFSVALKWLIWLPNSCIYQIRMYW